MARMALVAFNPTMVRLLQIGVEIRFVNENNFQSHNGAIAAKIGLTKSSEGKALSIPQWCDCCSQI